MKTIQDFIFLRNGEYLAPQFNTRNYNGLLVGVTNYASQVETGLWHSHEYPMISFVLYGTNQENRKRQSIERTAGSVNYYHSGELHQNIYNEFPSRHISLEIDPAFLKRYDYTEAQIERAVSLSEHPVFTFTQLLKEVNIEDEQSSNSVEMLFHSFIENSFALNEKKIPEWMKTVHDILNDRWAENISLDELSRKADVHPTTISKYFKKYFQCTLGEYTRKLKINRSIEILNNSNNSFTEVAYQCGFSDQSHFTRVFKSLTGFLPKEYLKLRS